MVFATSGEGGAFFRTTGADPYTAEQADQHDTHDPDLGIHGTPPLNEFFNLRVTAV